MERSNKLRPLLERVDARRNIFAIQYKGNRDVPLYKFVLAPNDKFFYEEIMHKRVNTVCEVIVENRPCHLYVDMDAAGKTKDDVVGYWKTLEPLFEEALRQKIKDDDLKIILLDSSCHEGPNQTQKGSLHIILKSKSFIFKNNQHCGTFVHLLKEVANQNKTTAEAFKYVDLAVYSKNRLMRMWGSTKYGQDRFLKWEGVDFNFKNWVETRICPIYTTQEKIELQDQYFGQKQVFSSSWTPPFMSVIVDYLVSVLKKQFNKGVINEIICVVPETLTYTFNTDIQDCLIAQRTHKTNHMYFIVHLMRGNYRYSCRSHHCLYRNRSLMIESKGSQQEKRREQKRLLTVTKLTPFPSEIQQIIDKWLILRSSIDKIDSV